MTKSKDEDEEAFVDYVCGYLDSLSPEESKRQEEWIREMYTKSQYGYKFTPED